MMRNTFLYFRIILVVCCILVLSCQRAEDTKRPRPKAIAGVLDLRQWDFHQDGPTDLSGEYEFIWKAFTPPQQSPQHAAADSVGFIKVPASWNGQVYHRKKLPGFGYGTYRLRILVDPAHLPPLAIKFQDMGTSFRAFINGHEIVSVGSPGRNRESTTPRYFPCVVEIPSTRDGELDFTIHVANFDHRRGGAWEDIRLGAISQMHRARENRLVFDLALFGAIMMIGMYNLALFTLRKEAFSLLYLGLFCLLISVRVLTTVERYLMQLTPAISWELFIKIEYLSYYVSVPVFFLFMRSLFPDETHRGVLRAVVAIGACFSLTVLLAPAQISSYTVPPYQFFTLFCLIYGSTILIRALLRKREGAAIIMIGYIVFFITVVNDLLDIEEVIHAQHWAHLGLFIFVFCQSFIVSFRYTNAFNTIDVQREKLTLANNQLELQNHEREAMEKEKRELQERLARSQKMEALGLLAGGVAHDLNNILSGTVTYPDFLLLDLPANSSLRKPLEVIRDSGLKAAAVVHDLLTLARRSIVTREPLNCNALISEYLNSPEHAQFMLNRPNIKIETQLDPALFNILGSPIHLKKTLMNLIANATEAQPGGGRILISTTNHYVDATLERREEIREGNYVLVEISDDGVGIDGADLEKIYEPFYTTKVMGRSGTGLGMAVVWGTVRDHYGFIDVTSHPDQGTRFRLYFPVTQQGVVQARVKTPLDDYVGNGEHILIVDDISEQRMIASSLLKRLGYRVSECAGGEQAVSYVQQNQVDLLLLDMIMTPGINGLETYKRVLAVRPRTRAVLASGFTETEEVREAQKLGAGAYIKKPYTLEKIGLAVRDELRRPWSGPDA